MHTCMHEQFYEKNEESIRIVQEVVWLAQHCDSSLDGHLSGNELHESTDERDFRD